MNPPIEPIIILPASYISDIFSEEAEVVKSSTFISTITILLLLEFSMLISSHLIGFPFSSISATCAIYPIAAFSIPGKGLYSEVE